jgi:DNA polymerase III psi subunit
MLAVLELPLGIHTKEEQDLFVSIMNTMTCQKPLIEEFSKSFDPKDTKELSSIIQMASNKTNGIISFGIPINTTTKFIQAASLSSIIDNPDLKKPLWEKIKKTFIK